MWDVVSALTPPLVVAAAFGFLLFKLLRTEMAPKRTSDLRQSPPQAPASTDDTPGDEGKSGGNTSAE